MQATNKLIVETKGKKVIIYSKEIINKIYSDISYFAFRYNNSQASQIPTDRYKVTLNDFINIKNSKGDIGAWYRTLTNDIKESNVQTTRFGSFFNPQSNQKTTLTIQAIQPLKDVYYYLNGIDETYLTSDIFKFKHEEFTDQLNPFSHDGNKLYLRDKETIIKRIIEKESVTMSKDKWEQFCELFNVTNFVGNVQIKEAISNQNELINYINENNEKISNLCHWDIKKLRHLIRDKKTLERDLWVEHIGDIAHELGQNTEELVKSNMDIYNKARENFKAFINFTDNMGYRAYNQTLTIWKDGIVNVDENNVLTINEKEREKVLKEHFNYYEYDYPSMSEERLKNAFDEVNQGIENEKTIEDIMDIINGHIRPSRH